jgi:hypothetical protein
MSLGMYPSSKLLMQFPIAQQALLPIVKAMHHLNYGEVERAIDAHGALLMKNRVYSYFLERMRFLVTRLCLCKW